MTETAHWLSSSEWDRDSLAFLSLPLDADGELGPSLNGARALCQSGPREYLLPLFPELTDVQQLDPDQSPSPHLPSPPPPPPPAVKTEQPQQRSKAKREPAAKPERRPTRSRHSSTRQRSPELIVDRALSTPPVVHISTSLPSMGSLACVEPPSCASKSGQLPRPVSSLSSSSFGEPKKRERRATPTTANPTKRQATMAGAKKCPPSEKPSRAHQHTRPTPIMPSVAHSAAAPAHPHDPLQPLVLAREKIEACLQMLGQLPIELSEDLSAAFVRVSSPPVEQQEQQPSLRQLETALSRLALRLIGDERSQQLFDYRLAERPVSAPPADGQSDGIPAYLAQQLPYLTRPVAPSWYASPAALSTNPPLPNFTAIAPAPPKPRQPLLLPRNTLLSRPPAPPAHAPTSAKTTS